MIKTGWEYSKLLRLIPLSYSMKYFYKWFDIRYQSKLNNKYLFFLQLSHSSVLHLMKSRILSISKEEDILQLREELACLTKLWNFITQLHIFPKRSTNVYNILFTPGKGSQILWNVKSLGWQYLNLVIEYN